MGSSSSKPSKPPRKPNKPTPLSYPHLEPLPYPPLPHHPTSSRPDLYQELAGRYGRILADNPIYAGTKKVEAGGAYRAQAAPAPTQQARSKQTSKAQAAYQFRPLGEIGRAPAGERKGGVKVPVKPQPQPQLHREAAIARPKAAYQFKPLGEIGRTANPARGKALAKPQPFKQAAAAVAIPAKVKAQDQFKPLSEIGTSRASLKSAKNNVCTSPFPFLLVCKSLPALPCKQHLPQPFPSLTKKNNDARNPLHPPLPPRKCKKMIYVKI